MRIEKRGRLQLEGVYSVLPTPFTATGDVDEDSLRRVVDLFIGAGVNGVTVLGVTGEVARLDDRERQRVLETVATHVNGRIGVVAGTTAEGTRTCIGYSLAAKAAGATAVMISPPRISPTPISPTWSDVRNSTPSLVSRSSNPTTIIAPTTRVAAIAA